MTISKEEIIANAWQMQISGFPDMSEIDHAFCNSAARYTQNDDNLMVKLLSENQNWIEELYNAMVM